MDATGEAYFTGFGEAPTESTIAELLKYVSASDKTSYADTEKVYAFLKDKDKLQREQKNIYGGICRKMVCFIFLLFKFRYGCN